MFYFHDQGLPSFALNKLLSVLRHLTGSITLILILWNFKRLPASLSCIKRIMLLLTWLYINQHTCLWIKLEKAKEKINLLVSLPAY
jgi:hypothetical protein